MTMKEACEYVKNSRIEKAAKHRAEVTQGNYCKPFTHKEYKKVKVKGKGAGQKGKKHAHTKLWNSSNHSNRIHTMYFDGTL